jgi:hypothetical protein
MEVLGQLKRRIQMKRLISLLITLAALAAFVLPAAASSPIPYFNIMEVVKDQSVTIQVYNFPVNDSFRVTMGAYGSYGINGVVVATTNTGSSTSFTATYTIPSTLAGSERLAIRLVSPTSGFFAYNWFWNNPPSSTTPAPTPIPGYSGFPTFSIKSVVQNQSVTILTSNLPPSDTFTVTMGKYGTKGIGGIVVATTSSEAGGSLELTYTIPTELSNFNPIAIRMQSPTTGYFAYNWFWNTNSSVSPTPTPPSSTPPPSGYSGFPTFSITAVVKDSTVTISGVNFPPNGTFNVLMGLYGTKGVNGTSVGSTSTGSGGSLSATYNIPSLLAGSTKIAIRLQSPTSGYFAYNWFWNNTAP